MKVVTLDQMVGLEQAAVRCGIRLDTLMENAGRAVAEAARTEMGGTAGKRVLVLVGPGNNGADGLVAARHLSRWGANVTAYLVTDRPDPDPKMKPAQEYGVGITGVEEDPEFAALDGMIGSCHLVIDSILGTGRSRPLTGAVKAAVSRLDACRQTPRRPSLMALDLPTGLNPDTGDVDPACPKMDVTVALGYPKVGLLGFPGAEKAGRLEVVGIGIPPGLPEESEIDLELMTQDWVGEHLPVRPLNSHKGTFGHALVVAGSRNYVGAAFLASQAAVRTGTGLTTLASPSGVYPIAASKLTEVIHLPLPEDEEGRFHPEASQALRDRLGRYSVMLVGCGMGSSSGTRDFLEQLLLDASPPSLPMVIDADGLNNLSRLDEWWRRVAAPVVLTPHPGEMATLTGSTTSEIQGDRINSARHWSRHWNAIVVLKGAHTLIAEPGGVVRISPFANPGLASGGTGDVLAGIITGLIAQGLPLDMAASCGVFVHGQAGEAVRDRIGDTGSIASDLVGLLPETIRDLKRV
jgi:NAD(P)H-hydrate epimerase